MHKHLRYTLIAALLLLPGIHPLRAGGWVQELGVLYAKLTYGSSSANTVYRFDGNEKYPTDNPPYTVRDYPLAERSLFFYGEYGLTPDLTLVGSTALKRVIVTSPVERKEVQGLGDVMIGARYRLLQEGAHVVSASLNVGIPTGYSRDLAPPLGSGNLNIELAGNYGLSLWPLPGYATGTLGYRLRTDIFLSKIHDETRVFDPHYADEVFGYLEAGWTFEDAVIVHGVANAVFSTRTDNNDFDVEHPPETQQYIKVGGGVIAKVGLGFELSADIFVTPYGRKASNSTDLMLGVAWKGNILGEEKK